MVNTYRDRRDRVVVGFTTTYGISDGEVYHIQHFMIKFVSETYLLEKGHYIIISKVNDRTGSNTYGYFLIIQ
jgi:hypothetical protein